MLLIPSAHSRPLRSAPIAAEPLTFCPLLPPFAGRGALQELPPPGHPDALQLIASLRRVAAKTEGAEGDAGARLREALPRVLAGGCERSERAVFSHPTDPSAPGWRGYATGLLAAAVEEDERAALGGPPTWLHGLEPGAPLFRALDAVLRRKRIPCHLKRTQIEAMQAALGGRHTLTGEPLADIDVDAIFLLEKHDKSYLPQDKMWFQPQRWT